MSKLVINNLHVQVENQKVLKGINVEFQTGKTYALIGPNGQGKSTLLSAIMGDPDFKISQGKIFLNDFCINDWPVDKRAQKGIFLGMQYPAEIAGVKNVDVIKTALNKKNSMPQSMLGVYAQLLQLTKQLHASASLLDRDLNVGFSGGEKKKNEILQMLMLKPQFAFLDEVDSGLDVDSILAVAHKLKQEQTKNNALIIVSHYQKLYKIIKPDVVLIMKNGQIVQKGDYELLMHTLTKGFTGDITNE